MTQDTYMQIMDSALRLMQDRGYHAFSFADISDIVKIRKASIHHHFPTKSILVLKVLSAHREKLKSGLVFLQKTFPNPIERLAAYASFWEKCIEDKSQPFCIAALLAAELPSLPNEIKTEIQKHFEDLKNGLKLIFDEVNSNSKKSRFDSAAEADYFIANIHGAMLSARVSGNPSLFKIITKLTLEKYQP